MRLAARLLAVIMTMLCGATAMADKTVVHVITLVTTIASDSTVTTRVANVSDQVIVDSLTVTEADSVAMLISSPIIQSLPVNATATVTNPPTPTAVTPAAKAADTPLRGTFAWEAETGGSIDMSAGDMSSIDIAASFGYKRGVVKFIGVGAAMNVMVNNSARSFPIYLAFKTNFRRRPSLVFLDLRGGVSMNYLPNDYQQNAFYGMAGLGINLAQGKKFSSYLVLAYTYKQFDNIELEGGRLIRLDDIHSACVRLGVTF